MEYRPLHIIKGLEALRRDMSVDDSIVSLAKDYIAKQEEFQELAERLRFNHGKVSYEESLEGDLVKEIVPKKFSGKVAAIDGGVANEQMHGLDIVITRSVAVCFEYVDGELADAEYFPNSRPEAEFDAKSCAESFEAMRFSSLIRLRSELSCAIDCMNEWELDYLLIDGSLAPLVSDKPPAESEMHQMYGQVVDLYKRLYETCAKKRVNLVGVMKDSRGKRFVEMLARSTAESKESLLSTSDTVFLDHLLKENERTFVFRYSKVPSKNPIMKDLGEWSDRILTMYLKPVKKDRPLRIEYLAVNDLTFDEVASTISRMSAVHPHYAYPPILIEVDLRAAMDPVEVERLMGDLSMRIGHGSRFMPLRRDSRPFR